MQLELGDVVKCLVRPRQNMVNAVTRPEGFETITTLVGKTKYQSSYHLAEIADNSEPFSDPDKLF